MIYKLHYWFMSAGFNAISILMGVFLETYTDASKAEIGSLFMVMPFTGLIFKPLICSLADRRQAHQKYMMCCLLMVTLSYMPFVVIPLLGPSLYEAHPRACWYFLVTFKVMGAIAFGGACSIGDSLAINYARRINVDFSIYRMWGTISWMVFGILVGQVNEVSFLPKYVPGFIILVASSFLNMFIFYLWPKEYFVMKSSCGEPTSNDNLKKQQVAEQEAAMQANPMVRSLVPRDQVWAHAKLQIKRLLTCSICCPSKTATAAATRDKCQTELRIEMTKTPANVKRQTSVDVAASDTDAVVPHAKPLRFGTQMRILALLLRHDPRILFYLLMFVFAGLSFMPIGFFFMELSNICHETGECDFSQLSGFLQFSMAAVETILFIYIKRIIAIIGRLNAASIAFSLTAFKYLFYGTIYLNINPHFALLIELTHGMMYVIHITIMVDMGHQFASEVEHLIPDLLKLQVVDPHTDREVLKNSLASTMQALISCTSESLGIGLGALIAGFLLDAYSYTVLWLTVGSTFLLVLAVTETFNLLDFVFKFNLNPVRKRLSAMQDDDGDVEQTTNSRAAAAAAVAPVRE